jgi:uncharacterized protein
MKAAIFSLMYYFRMIVYLVVLTGFQQAIAGSYDDFFKAIELDDEVTINSLLQRGFDPNTVNPNGTAGLLLALQGNAIKVANSLLRWSSTKIDIRNDKDESPLMLAALNGHAQLCQTLIDKGAAVNKPGWAPLHYAATHGQVVVIHLLLDDNAFIDARSPNGTTPLMMAAYYGTPSAVKVLLEAGADLSLKNDLGLNALDFANRGKHNDSAELISAFMRGRIPQKEGE